MDYLKVLEDYKKLDIRDKLRFRRGMENSDELEELQLFKERLSMAQETIEGGGVSVDWIKENILKI